MCFGLWIVIVTQNGSSHQIDSVIVNGLGLHIGKQIDELAECFTLWWAAVENRNLELPEIYEPS